MEREQRRFYVVRGRAKHGVITYKCPTVEGALDTLRRFKHQGHQDIAIHDPDGAPLTEADLEALASGSELPLIPAVVPAAQT